MNVAIVTCRVKPEPDPDEQPLVEALAQRGVTATVAAWDDDAVDWSRFDRAVLRSTWNYIHHADAFLAWMERTSRATRLDNPLAVTRANLDKIYLLDLSARGVPVVPTWFVGRGEAIDFTGELARRGWTDVVVKPRVGAGSFATRRFGPDAIGDGAAFAGALAAERDVMIQPYLPSVDGYGERALVWVAGALTHAVRKTPRLSGEDERVSEALTVAPEERRLAEAALAPVAADLLYARVEVARDDADQPIVMELELCEPSLFLAQHPPALARLADAIAGG